MKKKIGYKATYNMKCKNLTYEVGKEYIITDKKICHHGFHYCEKLEDTLYYTPYRKDKSVFIEIEDLDPESILEGNKTVSSHIKILRVVPKEELPERFKFDKRGNMTSNGDWEMTYDEKGNVLTFQDSNDVSWERTLDENGNELSYKNSEGFSWEKTYNEKGNQIFYKDSDGISWEIQIK